GTRRAYRVDVTEFCRWLESEGTALDDVDVRTLVEYVGLLGSGRRPGGRLAPATISRKLAAVRAFLRHSLGPARVPDARLGPRRPTWTRARRKRRIVPLGYRQAARHEHVAATRPTPSPPPACVRDASARGRRRPAHDPGALGAFVTLDDADLQPRRRAAAAQGLRQLAPALLNG